MQETDAVELWVNLAPGEKGVGEVGGGELHFAVRYRRWSREEVDSVMRKMGRWLKVRDQKTILAMGYSQDERLEQ